MIRKKITKKFLKKHDACEDGVEWFESQKETDGLRMVKKLMKEKRLDWANWLIVRLMKYKQYVSYAVYAAEQVIDIYEKKYPDDDRPRKAIAAAKKCIKNPSKQNKNAAADAADAAAYVAAHASDVSCSAYAAAYAAYAAVDVADAADAADAAADAARKKMGLKILKHGIKILNDA